MKTFAVVGILVGVCIAVILAVVLTSVGAAPASEPQSAGTVTKAIVFFNVGDRGVNGSLTLTQEGGIVTIKGKLTGLHPKGLHGFHVHESGNIGNGCTSTKSHFNPSKVDHGAPSDSVRHVGDLGNVEANEKGEVTVEITDTLISLSGEKSVLGRAFVVHEKEDDLGKTAHQDSKKTGNAGGRLGCGIIGVD